MLVNSNFLKLGLKFFFYSKLLYAMDSDFALLWDNPEIKAKYGGAHLPFQDSGSRDDGFKARLSYAARP